MAQATGRRWCVYHNGETDADNGSMVQPNRGPKKFMCFSCQKNRADVMKNRRK